jgi:hypothetical protein
MADPRAAYDKNIYQLELVRAAEAGGGGTGGTGTVTVTPTPVPTKHEAITASPGNWAIRDVLTRFQTVSTTGAITTNWYGPDGTLLSTVPVIGTDVKDLDQQLLAAIKATSSVSTAEISTVSVDLTQHAIPATFTLPGTIGGQFTVTVTPSATATNTLYTVGDRVVLTETSATTGGTTKTAYANVVAVAGEQITLSLTFGIVSAVFAANSEITGLTRLPAIPPTAKSAVVYFGWPPASYGVAIGTSGLQPLASKVFEGFPIAYSLASIGAGSSIDLMARPGYAQNLESRFQLSSLAAMQAYRIYSAMPLALRPYIEVTYY